MKPVIYRGPCYLVEGPNGADLVPADVVGELGLPVGHEVDIDDGSVIWPSLVAALADYNVSGDDITSVELIDCWYGRYSADGYMDCTDWHWGTSEAEVRDELENMYGDQD
jgi:hypothetical protein